MHHWYDEDEDDWWWDLWMFQFAWGKEISLDLTVYVMKTRVRVPGRSFWSFLFACLRLFLECSCGLPCGQSHWDHKTSHDWEWRNFWVCIQVCVPVKNKCGIAHTHTDEQYSWMIHLHIYCPLRATYNTVPEWPFKSSAFIVFPDVRAACKWVCPLMGNGVYEGKLGGS